MGCDIHLFCERRIDYDKWECVDRFKYENEGSELSVRTVKDIPRYFSPASLYCDRSYAFFTMLAGVRNTGGVKQIADRRGFPNDASDLVKAYADYWGSDAHSFSWYTADELFRYKYKLDNVKQKTEETEWAYDAICKLCKNLAQRIAEECYIEADSESFLDERLKKYAKEFRVVFWFDC